MKELKSQKMKFLLETGIRRAKRNKKKCPGDGGMTNLVYETLKNGWHYQVEWVHDTRIRPKPYIVVFSFPPHHRGSNPAPYYLMSRYSQ